MPSPTMARRRHSGYPPALARRSASIGALVGSRPAGDVTGYTTTTPRRENTDGLYSGLINNIFISRTTEQFLRHCYRKSGGWRNLDRDRGRQRR